MLKAVILGTDAVLAARPATPTQLARACLRAGFEFVAPVSWGEELLANAIIESVRVAAADASIIVHCPYVAEALRESGLTLPCCCSSVAPPVATARYLRAAFQPRPVHLTYAGACPGASAPDIDACVLPEVLLSRLLESGLTPDEQPYYFEQYLPPDRSRYSSLPGGVPEPGLVLASTGRRLREAAPATILAVLPSPDFPDGVVIDVEAAVGCVCARDRFAIAQIEPPRASGPVVTPGIVVDLALDGSETGVRVARRDVKPMVSPPATPLLASSSEAVSSAPRPLSEGSLGRGVLLPWHRASATWTESLEPWLRVQNSVRSVLPAIPDVAVRRFAAAAPVPEWDAQVAREKARSQGREPARELHPVEEMSLGDVLRQALESDPITPAFTGRSMEEAEFVDPLVNLPGSSSVPLQSNGANSLGTQSTGRAPGDPGQGVLQAGERA